MNLNLATKKFSPRTAQPDPARANWRPLAVAALVFAVFTLFSVVGKFSFIDFDDPEYVTGNPQVLNGLTARGIFWALSTGHAGNWHPITWMSHMVDANLFGLNPAGPHWVNLVLHLANVLLLMVFLTQITRRFWPGFWVAAFFALHPLRVESVAWVSERKDVLSVFFWLICLIAYSRYAGLRDRTEANRAPGPQTPQAPDSPSRAMLARRWYWASIASFALGLMSKPMLVTTPFLLLLLDFWPLGRWPLSGPGIANRIVDLKPLLREKAWFFALSAGDAAATFLAQHNVQAVVGINRFSLGARFSNAGGSIARYLGKIFWPSHLAVPYPLSDWPSIGTVAAGFVLLIGISLLAIYLRRCAPYVFTGWFWFLGTLLPVLGIVQVGNQAMADRYTYFPSIGLSIAVVWVLAALARNNRFALGGLCILGIAALGACAWKTHRQLPYWQNSETLFRHSIQVTSGNFIAHDNLGFALFQEGKTAEAMDEYRKALRINPEDPGTLNNMGTALARQGDLKNGVQAYESALRSDPRFEDARNNLGVALFHLEKTDEAEKQYRIAIKLNPNDAEAHNNLANLLVSRGMLDQAVVQYRIALSINPRLPTTLNNLGWVLGEQGEFRQSLEIYGRALELNPKDPSLHSNAADVLANAGKTQMALDEYNRALRLNPNFANAHAGLGALLLKQERFKEAAQHLRKALSLNPADSESKKLLEETEAAEAAPRAKAGAKPVPAPSGEPVH
ncbi:MAG TPA: tetratricopeptide repeat protein [Verrucomicrobiae bacterium]|nr:tetratricopeptide repeat protein [Verrucomicrobiae bacterium]